MAKWRMALVGLSLLTLLTACATGTPTQQVPQGITFDTGKSRRAVMNVIVNVGTHDGFTLGSISNKDGGIVFKPRKMLDGVLSEKISDGTWNF